MYSTDSRTIRILAQPGIDFIEALESELERSIILTSGGGSWGRGHDRATIAREKFPDVENPIVVVMNTTLTPSEGDGQWWYMPHFPNEFLVDTNKPNYFPYGEFLGLYAEQYEGVGFSIISLENSREMIFAEAEENLVTIGMHLPGQTSVEYVESMENLNWERLLGEPIRLAASDDMPERIAQIRHERRQRAFDAYVTNGRDRALRQLRQNIASYESNIQMNQSQLTQNLRNLNDAGKQVTALEATLTEDSGVWKRRFEELCEHPKLTDVDFTNETFVLTTDHLRMEHPDTGATRWLGRIKIRVPLSGEYGYSITFENLDNPKGGRAHPHVAGDGPCFGGISSTVSKLHAELELMALTDVLIMFLETFNPRDDWGSYAAYWFDVEDEDPRNEGGDIRIDESEMAVA